MEITDELLGQLDVDEDWCIDSRGDSDLGTLIDLVEGANEVGVYDDLGVNVCLWVQTLGNDVIYKMTCALDSGIDLAVPGTEIDELVDFELTGFEQARAILETVRGDVAAALAKHKSSYMRLGEAKHDIAAEFPHPITVHWMGEHWFIDIGRELDPASLKANLYIGDLLIHELGDEWEGRTV
jgi:hypothetical protein